MSEQLTSLISTLKLQERGAAVVLAHPDDESLLYRTLEHLCRC